MELPYPADLLAPLGQPSGLRYEPHPLGLPEARDAVAADQMRRGAVVDPDQVVLTASTSEAYGWLFKLLCEPGEASWCRGPATRSSTTWPAPRASRRTPYSLRFHGRWEVDLATVEAAPPHVKALVAVSPNNPTGSCLDDARDCRRSRRFAGAAAGR